MGLGYVLRFVDTHTYTQAENTMTLVWKQGVLSKYCDYPPFFVYRALVNSSLITDQDMVEIKYLKKKINSQCKTLNDFSHFYHHYLFS